MTQLGQGFGFDLADALPGELEAPPDLVESTRLTSVEPEAQA
jgi:hypothetical protein